MHSYLTCSVVDSWLHIELTTNTFLNVVRNYETYMSSKIKGDFKNALKNKEYSISPRHRFIMKTREFKCIS